MSRIDCARRFDNDSHRPMIRGTSKQRELLPRAVARLAALDPACGVLLIGSVQHGYERPGSDIDLMAIVHDGIRFDPAEWQVRWENRGAHSIAAPEQGVELCVFFAPVSGLERWLAETPYHMYPLSRGEILADPDGLARRCQAAARRYFDEHPALAREWEAQLEAHRQVKLTGRAADGFYRTDDGHRRKYLTLDAFAAHISEMARRGR